jgi:hypothetical protein
MAKYKRFRRFVWLTITLIVVALASFWGYIKYQQQTSYQTPIPKNTTALLRIDVYRVYKSILSEYFEKKKSRQQNILKGIKIPANIFCYMVKGKQPTTFFLSVPVDDVKKLQQSLHEQKLILVRESVNGISILTSSNKKWTIAYNNIYLAIAYSATCEMVTDMLTDIILQRNMVPVKSSNFKAICSEKGHFTFLSGSNKGSLNFNRGNITATFVLSARNLSIPAETNHQKTQPDDVMNLWCYADFGSLLAGKTFSLDSLSIHGDSLLKYNLHGIELTIAKPVLQRDTVITYDYNDDFEKVATTTIKEKKVPGISFMINADAHSLYQYLQRARVMDKEHGIVNRSLFPLYQLNAAEKHNHLSISTIKEMPAQRSTITSTHFFGLYINFGQLILQEDFVLFHRYIKPYKYLQAKAQRRNAQEIKLDVTLQFRDGNRQSISQILETF